MKEEEVVEMQTRLSYNDVYLESPLNYEGTDTMMDMLSTEEDVEDIVNEKETLELLAERVKEFKTTLNEKEACILDHRLMAEEPRTLEERSYPVQRQQLGWAGGRHAQPHCPVHVPNLPQQQCDPHQPRQRVCDEDGCQRRCAKRRWFSST